MPGPAIPQLKRHMFLVTLGEKPPQKSVGFFNSVIIIVDFLRGRSFLRFRRRQRTILLMITAAAIPLMVRRRLLVAARGVLRLRGVGRVAAAAATAVLGLAVLWLAVWRGVLAVGLLLRAAVGGVGVG